MHNTVPYNKEERGRFQENWRPHRDVADIWQIQGILHEPSLPQAVYSYNLSIFKISYPFESFYAIHYGLGDTLSAHDDNELAIIPIQKGDKAQLSFDEDSIFFDEHAQILDTEHAFALRLRGTDFGLDLRLDKKRPPVWYGENGKVYLSKIRREAKSLFGGVRTNMKTFGRLFLDGRDVRVEGVSALERCWGRVPYKIAQIHWEKFYLFLEDVGEVMLMNFPLGGFSEGIYIPKKGAPLRLSNYRLKTLDYLEIDDWRFSSLWQLDIPRVNLGPYYLIPVIKSQFALPVCRPLVGVFDKDGKNYGYGYAELMPGAQNKLDRISLDVFKNAPKT
jgi:hypothetical protein